jgi:hypothetical protein
MAAKAGFLNLLTQLKHLLFLEPAIFQYGRQSGIFKIISIT